MTGLGYPQTIAMADTGYIIVYYFGNIKLYQGLRSGRVMWSPEVFGRE